jgi:hypothetical protein
MRSCASRSALKTSSAKPVELSPTRLEARSQTPRSKVGDGSEQGRSKVGGESERRRRLVGDGSSKLGDTSEQGRRHLGAMSEMGRRWVGDISEAGRSCLRDVSETARSLVLDSRFADAPTGPGLRIYIRRRWHRNVRRRHGLDVRWRAIDGVNRAREVGRFRRLFDHVAYPATAGPHRHSPPSVDTGFRGGAIRRDR